MTIDQDKLGELAGTFVTGLGATIASPPGSDYENARRDLMGSQRD